jgi:uncharacterized protein YodC (DUF2158 family)
MKDGDVVRLKSGGVSMVVTFTTDSWAYADVEWHDKLGQPHKRTYNKVVLEKI